MELIDISLPISENTPVWEGDKHPEFNTITSIEKGDPYNSTSIRIGAHTGTHIDAPRHFLENGETLEKIPLSKFTGTAQVVEVDDAVMAINENILSSLNLRPDIRKILFKTRNSQFWIKEPFHFRKDFTAFTSDGAEYLAQRNYELVGIDSFSISVFDDMINPHKILMENNTVVLENADLHLVNPGIYTLICLPLPLIGVEASPVRAVLIV